MPNYCENKLTIKGKKEEVEACLAAIRGEPRGSDLEPSSAIDFGKIIPMPESLAVEDSTTGDDALLAFHGEEDPQEARIFRRTIESLCELKGVVTRDELQEKLLREHPECRKLADTYRENIRLHGHKTWYGWSNDNWGTKWNACRSSVGTRETKGGMTATLRFSTAWSPPRPVIRRLIASWPELSFALRYWEGGAGFQGKLTGKGGSVEDADQWEYRGQRGG